MQAAGWYVVGFSAYDGTHVRHWGPYGHHSRAVRQLAVLKVVGEENGLASLRIGYVSAMGKLTLNE